MDSKNNAKEGTRFSTAVNLLIDVVMGAIALALGLWMIWL
jgi:hypothetical protein